MISSDITPKSLFAAFEQRLQFRYDSGEIRSLYYLILKQVTRWDRASVVINREKSLPFDQASRVCQYLDRLVAGEPIQYIIGTVQFLDMELLVSPGVLIPRPETEEMASLIIRDCIPKLPLGAHILDIGTGSGCLALALKKARSDLHVTALEISTAALKVARKNAEALCLDITWKHGDLMNRDEWKKMGSFDLIVSNPPYIPQHEKLSMCPHVTAHEPGIALFVPDDDPLIFYRHIHSFLHAHLSQTGIVFLEIHEKFSKAIVMMFRENRDLLVEEKKDFRGKDRFVILRKK